MKDNYFYTKLQRKSDAELERLLDNPTSYTEDAVLAATQILKDRKFELSEERISASKKIKEKREIAEKVNKAGKKQPVLASFTKRVFAFGIDLLLLSIISSIIGFLLIGSPLIKAPWEALLSWGIITGYFIFFNGKTIGKRIMSIRVENYDHQPINFRDAIIRYTLIFTPFFLLNFLDDLSFNSFGLLTGLRYSYYLAVIYFIITDKEFRRGYHDLVSKTFVNAENQTADIVEFPKNKISIFLFLAGGVIALSVVVYLATRTESSDRQVQTAGLQTTLDENRPAMELMISDIQKVDGVAEIEGIGINTTNEFTILIITIRANSFLLDEGLSDRVYQSVKGKQLALQRLDNVKIITHYGIDMTLSFFNKTKIKNYEQ